MKMRVVSRGRETNNRMLPIITEATMTRMMMTALRTMEKRMTVLLITMVMMKTTNKIVMMR